MANQDRYSSVCICLKRYFSNISQIRVINQAFCLLLDGAAALAAAGYVVSLLACLRLSSIPTRAYIDLLGTATNILLRLGLTSVVGCTGAASSSCFSSSCYC